MEQYVSCIICKNFHSMYIGETRRSGARKSNSYEKDYNTEEITPDSHSVECLNRILDLKYSRECYSQLKMS